MKKLIVAVITILLIILYCTFLGYNKFRSSDNIKEDIKESQIIKSTENSNDRINTIEKENSVEDKKTNRVENKTEDKPKINSEADTSNENKSDSDKMIESNKEASKDDNNYSESTNNTSSTKKEENNSSITNNQTNIPKEEQKKDNPWDELGISENEYYYSPMWKWQEITFGIYNNYVNQCTNKSDCFSKCKEYGNKMLEENDGSFTCNEVISYSGNYLGEQFIFKSLDS